MAAHVELSLGTDVEKAGAEGHRAAKAGENQGTGFDKDLGKAGLGSKDSFDEEACRLHRLALQAKISRALITRVSRQMVSTSSRFCFRLVSAVISPPPFL